MISLKELIQSSRTIRRFYQDELILETTLIDLIDLARLSPSAGNIQPLKYVISNTPSKNDLIFSCLGWAGYLKDWPGPEKGEQPSAYIIILGDLSICRDFGCDHGIACQSIMLGAREKGLGGCIIGAIQRQKLKSILKLSDQYDILLVLALGKPKENVIIEEISNNQEIQYYRDSDQCHHVPKRKLEDIIIVA